jgi:hypothetical protein
MATLKVTNNRVEGAMFFGNSKITEIPEGTVFGGYVEFGNYGNLDGITKVR